VKQLEKLMEEMANLKKEKLGERQPGEVGMYELSQIPIHYRSGYIQAVKDGKSEEFIKMMRTDAPPLLDRP
jgi:hypothetical protein